MKIHLPISDGQRDFKFSRCSDDANEDQNAVLEAMTAAVAAGLQMAPWHASLSKMYTDETQRGENTWLTANSCLLDVTTSTPQTVDTVFYIGPDLACINPASWLQIRRSRHALLVKHNK